MKLIIDNQCENVDIETSITYINHIIKMGLISTGTYGKQFCHVTTFSLGAKEIAVSADKRKSGTHKFVIFEKGAVHENKQN
jgi:hypothetical protein